MGYLTPGVHAEPALLRCSGLGDLGALRDLGDLILQKE